MVPRALNRARCAHLDLRALDTDALQMVILQAEGRHNRGREHVRNQKTQGL